MVNLGNVAMLPHQPVGRLNDLLNAADLHLLPPLCQRRKPRNAVASERNAGQRVAIAESHFGARHFKSNGIGRPTLPRRKRISCTTQLPTLPVE